MPYPLIAWDPSSGSGANAFRAALSSAGCVQLLPGLHLITDDNQQGWDESIDYVHALVAANPGMQAIVISAEAASTQVAGWVYDLPTPNALDVARRLMSASDNGDYPALVQLS